MPVRSLDGRKSPLSTAAFGSGPRIALVHGFTQTGRSWEPLIPGLSRRFEVLTVDLPGHGRSATADAEDLDEAGRMLADAVGDAVYVGYSMGGRVVLHAGFVAPEHVRSMVLIGVSPGIADAREREERRRADDALADRLDGAHGESPSIDAFIDEWLRQAIFAGLSREAADRAARLENTTHGLAQALRHLGTGNEVYDPERLARLAMPVAIIAGEHDEKFRRLGEEMAAAIGANAAAAVIDGAGHAAPFEQPLALATAISTWMDLHHRR